MGKQKTQDEKPQKESVGLKGSAAPHKSNGVFLVVCGDGDDFSAALRYAVHMAQSENAHIGLLSVSKIEDFQNWADIEERMRHEKRVQSEKKVWAISQKIYEASGLVSAIYLEEGDTHEVLVEVINRQKEIKSLILGADIGSSGPGPLVSYFSSKGISKIPVPLIIVPENSDTQRFEA